MERSRSKRFNHTYDDDYGGDNRPRSRTRYSSHSHSLSSHHFRGEDHEDYHRRFGDRKPPLGTDLTVTTRFKILCHDARAGGVIGKAGSIIKAIRQHTGARVYVNDLVSGDEEHVIDISDTRTRNPEGHMPEFSPAQEALILVHERILESYDSHGHEDYESRRGGRSKYSYPGHDGGSNRVVTRLVVPNVLVGSLMGRGGKIIQQMRATSKAHIRILTSEHTLPRCVAASEEIVQVAGEVDSVRDALEMIAWRLRECQHRDQNQSRGRHYSPEWVLPYDDDLTSRRSSRRSSTSMDSVINEPRFSEGLTVVRSNKYPSKSPGYATESSNHYLPVAENVERSLGLELVFKILCPVEKLNAVVGESDGIIKLLQNEIGVNVKVADRIAGSDEQIIIISSDEGPDDELFPAQEALLHIQSRLFGLDSEKKKTNTTRLMLQSSEIGRLGGIDGLSLQMRNSTGATVQMLPREEFPVCASESDEILQIVGDITAAREALIEVTSRLRSCIYEELFQEETSQTLASDPCGLRSNVKVEDIDCNATPSPRMNNLGGDPTASGHENSPNVRPNEPPKRHLFDLNISAVEELDSAFETCPSGNEQLNTSENGKSDNCGVLDRISVPVVTRSILEVAIPPHAASKLAMKSSNKLMLISELSGANVILLEEESETAEKFVRVSGTPEQTEKAQRLLQGFILSTEEDSS